jgi:hypothetical protein
MAIAMVYNVHNTTTIRFGFKKSKSKMEWWCWFVVMVCKATRIAMDVVQNACNTWTQQIACNTSPKLQVFKDDHDDEWVIVTIDDDGLLHDDWPIAWVMTMDD